MVSFLTSSALICLLILDYMSWKICGYMLRNIQSIQPRSSTKVFSTSQADAAVEHREHEGWWGRGGLPQKTPDINLLPARPSYSHYPIEQEHVPLKKPKEKKPRRTTLVYKHMFRYYTDISVECWLATVTPEELLNSCGYSIDDVAKMANEFPPLLRLDVRRHLAPKLRFLVQCLGGGEGDICHGECLDEVMPAEDEECQEFHPHDLAVSDVAKKVVPPSFFGQRLEKILAPRHAYLEFCHDLPHGSALLSDDGKRLREFVETCGKSTAEFSALCNKWARERKSDTSTCCHDTKRIDAFQRSFSRGLLAAARSDMSEDMKLLGCTPGRMVELLVGHGANPIEHDRSGASLLHWAAGTGNLCGTKAILHAMDPRALEEGRVGDDILMTKGDKDSATPLHWSSCGVDHNCFGCGGHVEICRFFLEEAGDRCNELANAQTITGNTPLMWACWSGSLEVAKLLVKNGADPHSENNNGCTAAHWAASGGHLEVCKYLHKTLGVDFRAENGAGHSPLNHAICYGRNDVAEWVASECYHSKDDAAALQREIDMTEDFIGSNEKKVREKLQEFLQGLVFK